jgi:hypothetical protein
LRSLRSSSSSSSATAAAGGEAATTAAKLTQVFEKFRADDLYSHWLNEFIRLHYVSSRFQTRSAKSQVISFLKPLHICGLEKENQVFRYKKGLLCDLKQLKWHFGLLHSKKKMQTLFQDLQMVNLDAAQVHSMQFLLEKWKMFMELCCLQPGNSLLSTNSTAAASVKAPSSPSIGLRGSTGTSYGYQLQFYQWSG